MINIYKQRLIGRTALALLVLFTVSGAYAQSGSLFWRNLTFAGSGTATLNFKVSGPILVDDPNNLPTTTLLLEFGKDGAASAIDPLLPNTVGITLKKGPTILPFTISALPSGNTSFTNKLVTMTRPNAANAPGLYLLTIIHQQSLPAGDEDWELGISGLPTNVNPVVRANAAVTLGRFSGLQPVAECGAAQQCPTGQSCKGPCPNVCPTGQSCQDILISLDPFPWWKFVKILWPIPFPNPPCLSCPKPWDNPLRDGYDRALLSVAPLSREGKTLGPGQASQIRLDIKGGEPFGELVDAGNGEYFQMIEFRKGTSPKISAIAAGVRSKEITVAEPTLPSEPEGRNFLLELLLSAITGVIGWFIGRRRGSGSGLTHG